MNRRKKANYASGKIGEKVNAATLKVRKAKTRTAILVVPVVGGTVQLSASKKPTVQVKVEVLGYRTSSLPLKAKGMSSRKLVNTKFDGTEGKTGEGDRPWQSAKEEEKGRRGNS